MEASSIAFLSADWEGVSRVSVSVIVTWEVVVNSAETALENNADSSKFFNNIL